MARRAARVASHCRALPTGIVRAACTENEAKLACEGLDDCTILCGECLSQHLRERPPYARKNAADCVVIGEYATDFVTAVAELKASPVPSGDVRHVEQQLEQSGKDLCEVLKRTGVATTRVVPYFVLVACGMDTMAVDALRMTVEYRGHKVLAALSDSPARLVDLHPAIRRRRRL